MKLKKHIYENIEKNSKKITFGIDYLRVNIQDVKSKIIHINKNLSRLIDYDNSNFIIFDEFGVELTAQKFKTSNGSGLIYSYSFFNTSIPLFCIIEYTGEHKSLFNSRGKLDFYGSFFRLIEIGEFESNYFFDDFIKEFNITRIDYRIDIFNYKYGYIDKEIVNSRLNTFEHTYKTSGKINSWRFGQRQNKSVVVRGYDKQLDSNKKGKWKLYSDYLSFDSVFRIEYEFLNNFCKGFDFGDLDDLVKKCRSYMGLNEEYKENYYTPYAKLDLSDSFHRMKYCKTMSSYIREALKNGINVYSYVDVEMSKIYDIDEETLEKIKNNNTLFTEYIDNNH